MPGPGVVDLIGRLKSAFPRLRILVLSVHPERHYARRVLRAGADGYLTKNHSPSTLAAAIRRVYGGHKYITPSLAEDLALDLAAGRESGAHETLSTREHQVFLRLGAGARVNEIAEQFGLSPKTVRTYRSRILEKLDLRSTAELIFYAVRNELVTQVESPLGSALATGAGTPYEQRRGGLGPTAGGEGSSHKPTPRRQGTRSARRA
jgi:DNA-binding NarL/FixJ family response regulator